MQRRARVDVYTDTLADESRLAERLADYPICVAIRERTWFSSSLLQRLDRLRLLALAGKYTGQVDLDAATRQGILVTETEGSGVAAMELTMALILACAKKLTAQDRKMRHGEWQTDVALQLRGKTLGILGLGKIGKRIAEFGNFLGMTVRAWGPTLTEERAAAASVSRVSLPRLFAESDIVSLHLRLVEETRGTVTADLLSRMKSSAYLVNTARGGLVDEEALVKLLGEEQIAGAALDVYREEPLPQDHPLRSLDNVILSPHMGFATDGGYELFFSQVARAVTDFLEAKLPERALNPEALQTP